MAPPKSSKAPKRKPLPADPPSPLPLTPGSEGKRRAQSSVASPSQDTAEETGAGSKRKRTVLGVVTANACRECQRRRAKCDGDTPCARCKSHSVECVYVEKVIQSKDELRNQIEDLSRETERLRRAFADLVHPPALREEVLSRLEGGQHVDDVSEWLRTTFGGGFLPPSSELGHGHGNRFTSVAAFTDPATGGTSNPTGGYPFMSPGMVQVATNPIGAQSQQLQVVRNDPDQPSPWGGHFSPHNQTTRSGSQVDMMNWETETVTGPSQSRMGSWSGAGTGTGTGTRADSTQGRGVLGSDRAKMLQRVHTDQMLRDLQRVLNLQRIPAVEGTEGMAHILSPEIVNMVVRPRTWTNVTDDSFLVCHLLALYFCWEYPTFASLSKEHFLKDFATGNPRFCSPMLVNALLALGCRFSSQPNTRANEADPHTSGDHFFQEALKLFREEQNRHNLTTIQALGIMAIREASCGRDGESWWYAGQSITLAIEMKLHEVPETGVDDDESDVRAATFWGAFALDHAWSLATGILPQNSCFPLLPPKPAIIMDIEASNWIPYTDDGKGTSPLGLGLQTQLEGTLSQIIGAPLERPCEQPSNVRSVYRCFCELSELVHRTLYFLHSPGSPIVAQDLVDLYTQYLDWYDEVPEVLKLGSNFTPPVLFVHMYYHFAILLLFRPFIKLKIALSSIVPRELCLEKADAISKHLHTYAQLYTLKRTPSFVPYFVLTSCIMHLAIAATGPRSALPGGSIEPRVSAAIGQGIEDLTEMTKCHIFAEKALNIVRFLARKWGVNITTETNPSGSEGQTPSNLNLVDSRSSSSRPPTTSISYFSPNITEGDFNCTWGGDQSLDRHAPVVVADDEENPLFWTFPMQGRPILPRGDALKEAGFELA